VQALVQGQGKNRRAASLSPLSLTPYLAQGVLQGGCGGVWGGEGGWARVSMWYKVLREDAKK